LVQAEDDGYPIGWIYFGFLRQLGRGEERYST
jgi:hypothetical protein